MKFLSFAVLSAALLLSGFSNEPASQFEATASKRVIVEPMIELHPRFDEPHDGLSPRQSLGSLYAERLDGLDDQVSNLKARCDLLSARISLDAEFEHLKVLRVRVLVALTNLRDPMIGVEAAEQAVEASLGELRQAIDGLSAKVDSLGPPRTT